MCHLDTRRSSSADAGEWPCLCFDGSGDRRKRPCSRTRARPFIEGATRGPFISRDTGAPRRVAPRQNALNSSRLFVFSKRDETPFSLPLRGDPSDGVTADPSAHLVLSGDSVPHSLFPT